MDFHDPPIRASCRSKPRSARMAQARGCSVGCGSTPCSEHSARARSCSVGCGLVPRSAHRAQARGCSVGCGSTPCSAHGARARSGSVGCGWAPCSAHTAQARGCSVGCSAEHTISRRRKSSGQSRGGQALASDITLICLIMPRRSYTRNHTCYPGSAHERASGLLSRLDERKDKLVYLMSVEG